MIYLTKSSSSLSATGADLSAPFVAGSGRISELYLYVSLSTTTSVCFVEKVVSCFWGKFSLLYTISIRIKGGTLITALGEAKDTKIPRESTHGIPDQQPR